jgi:hypothetical protein
MSILAHHTINSLEEVGMRKTLKTIQQAIVLDQSTKRFLTTSIAIVLAIMLCASLASCANGTDGGKGDTGAPGTTPGCVQTDTCQGKDASNTNTVLLKKNKELKILDPSTSLAVAGFSKGIGDSFTAALSSTNTQNGYLAQYVKVTTSTGSPKTGFSLITTAPDQIASTAPGVEGDFNAAGVTAYIHKDSTKGYFKV